MASLFDKISTLVNAQVNDLLGKNPRSPLARYRLNAEEADKNPRGTALTLRQRLDEAVDYEDELQAKVDGIVQEALALDGQVDAMLRSGDEFGARRLQGQLNMKQQQLTIAESELQDHRLVTQHLMREMAALDSALDSRERRERSQSASADSRAPRRRIPVEGSASEGTLLGAVSGKLNDARENLENLIAKPSTPDPPAVPRRYDKFDVVDEAPDPRQPKPHKKDANEMKGRLSRLSRPADEDD